MQILLHYFLSKKTKIKIFNLDYAINAIEGDHYKISGCFFIVKLRDFIHCGMMDSNTFLYCEEEILTERMYKIKRRVYYCNQVKIVHESGGTTNKFLASKRMKDLDFESNKYYYSKYIGTPSFIIKIGFIANNIVYYLKKILK